jgi:hypothetical protein
MAFTPMVLTQSMLLLNASDLSAYTSKIEAVLEVEDKDVTTFGSLGWKNFLGGLKFGHLAITWKNDVTAADLDSILFPLFGTVVTFEVRAVNTARSTSNPAYTGSVLVKTLQPISGAVGDVNEQSVTYPTSGVVTRATA